MNRSRPICCVTTGGVPQPAPLEEVPEAALPGFSSRDSDRIDSQTLLEPALSRLKPRERQLLWLVDAEGCSHREIAAITGLRAPSTRLLLFRVRRKMARLLRQRTVTPGKRR
jgi:RNA polymerase sigma-70 factor, ECF subfamily